METKDEKTEHDPEWENRVLCPDGNCIGVISPDGRCKECGMPGGEQPEITQARDDASGVSSQGKEADHESDDPDWQNRRLCPDGNCIGVIGPDGRCRECGREG